MRYSLRLSLLFLFLLSFSSVSAEEGFFPLRDLDGAAKDSFFAFPKNFSCGATRIHKSEQVYLTALHCLKDKITASSEIPLGDYFNYDGLVKYDNLAGKRFGLGNFKIKVLASGRCFTGFALDVISSESPQMIKRALECALDDWAIFQILPSSRSKVRARRCADTYEASIPSGRDITILGAPRLEIERTRGLTNIKGSVYARGKHLLFSDLLVHPEFTPALVPLWGNIMTHAPVEKLFVSSADVVNGMSGGPVFFEGRLIAMSTLALLPNLVSNYGLSSIDAGYTFGIHGAIPIGQIKTRLTSRFFNCRP